MTDYYIEQEPEILAENGVTFFSICRGQNCILTHNHRHEAIEILYMAAGLCDFYLNDTHFVTKPGDLIFCRSHDTHKIVTREAKQNLFYVLRIKPSMLYDLVAQDSTSSYAFHIILESGKYHWTKEELINSPIRTMFEQEIALYTSPVSYRDFALKIGCFRIMLEILRDLSSDEGDLTEKSLGHGETAILILKAIRYIDRHYAEEIDAQKCSQLLNISYAYFCKKFKAITGKSFKNYLNLVRIHRAEQLLCATNLDITDIAFRVGFNQVSYFIKVFKELNGTTPLQYKKTKHFQETE